MSRDGVRIRTVCGFTLATARVAVRVTRPVHADASLGAGVDLNRDSKGVIGDRFVGGQKMNLTP